MTFYRIAGYLLPRFSIAAFILLNSLSLANGTTLNQAESRDLKQDAAKYPRPQPDLSPADVIKIQLTALQDNNRLGDDGGIAIAFSFASPSNRAMTGPLDRFIDLVKNPLYAPLINHRKAVFGKIEIDEDQAEQQVTLIDARGAVAIYIFKLSKQSKEPYKDCWMTDAVIRQQSPREIAASGFRWAELA